MASMRSWTTLLCACRPGTWQEVLSTEDEEQRLARVEDYNNYADIVESQLGREIAALQEHSTEFFQASSLLEVTTLSLRCAPEWNKVSSHEPDVRLANNLRGPEC